MSLILPRLVPRPPRYRLEVKKNETFPLTDKNLSWRKCFMHLRVRELSCLSRCGFPVRIPSVRRVPPCCCCHVIDHRGYCFLSFISCPLLLSRFLCLNSGVHSSFCAVSFLGLPRTCSTLLQTARRYVHACLCLGDRSPSFSRALV